MKATWLSAPARQQGASHLPSQFKPETSALLLIDHQVGVMQMIKTLQVDEVKRLVLALAKAAKILKMPIILTTSVETAFQQPIFKELAEVLPDEYAARIKRKGIVNAWTDPNFRAAVESTGRKQLIMGAVTTDICLVYPAISAVEAGYEVQAVMGSSVNPPVRQLAPTEAAPL